MGQRPVGPPGWCRLPCFYIRRWRPFATRLQSGDSGPDRDSVDWIHKDQQAMPRARMVQRSGLRRLRRRWPRCPRSCCPSSSTNPASRASTTLVRVMNLRQGEYPARADRSGAPAQGDRMARRPPPPPKNRGQPHQRNRTRDNTVVVTLPLVGLLNNYSRPPR